MSKHRSEEEILKVLGELHAGESQIAICSRHGISRSSLGLWKRKYAGLQRDDLRQFQELRKENSLLKELVASLSLGRKNLKEALIRKL